jgi:RNA polymerase sigma-70 factor, ECF subfamily
MAVAMVVQETEVPDEHLVQQTLEGNTEAFSGLILKYKRRILTMASRFSRDAHTIDDIAQEVFIRAFQKLPQFRATAPFEHWLSRIAVRCCYDHLRWHQRRHLLFFSSGEGEADDSLDRLARSNDQGGQEAREAAADAIHRALGKLRPKERVSVTLLDLEERSVREVAELTGWSEANVKVKAHRARQKLKKILSQKGFLDL